MKKIWDFLSVPRMGSLLVAMKALAIKRSSWGVNAFPHSFEVVANFFFVFNDDEDVLPFFAGDGGVRAAHR